MSMNTLENAMRTDTLRTGRFHRETIRAAKLKADETESLASVHENHQANLSAAMKGIRALGGQVTKVKHLDYDALPMLKKRGIATGDLNKSTIHFNSGKNKFKLHVRTAHKLGVEGAEHNKNFALEHDDSSDEKDDASE